MPRKRKDVTGKRIGRLTYLEYSYSKNHRAYWKCKCDCGNETIASTSGIKKSCGCLQRESQSRNGKACCGEDMWYAKFTNEDIADIRSSSYTIKELAEIFGVSYTTIYRIIKRQTWKHLP